MKFVRASDGDRARVLLDGIERSRVIEASEEGRYIVIFKNDDRGNFVFNESGTELLTERLEGSVVVLPL
jgi:hypothetical protein